MAGEITGSIKALIGADTANYKKAMSEVVSVTQSAMSNAGKVASNSTNSIVSNVANIMGRLTATTAQKLSGITSGLVAPFNKAGGQIQRIVSSIGEKIPGPIKKGFNAVTKAATGTSSLVAKGLNKIVIVCELI